MMTGKVFDILFYGQSSIITSGMQSLTDNYIGLDTSFGFIEISKSCDEEDVMVAKVPHPEMS